MHQVSRIATALFVALVSSGAYGHYINGYAVSAHRSCGANNLPGTVTELQKFFASSNFPADAAKNIFYTNRDVRVTDWRAGGDYKESTSTASGYDGADASLITYIASHGVTSNDRYTALAGDSSSGCNIRSNEMSIGDNNTRYLVLSTCQGLKIGTGDNPSRPGANPSRTWSNGGNAGLNCIFGYSNNMMDSDRYGTYLLDNLANADETLTQAFLRASRRVSYDNIAAVMCFGPTDEEAKNRLETVNRFAEESFGKGGSAWTYSNARRLSDAFKMPRSKVLRTVVATVQAVDDGKLAKTMLGSGMERVSAPGAQDDVAVYRSQRGLLTYDGRTGTASWQSGKVWSKKAYALSDEKTMQLARSFVKAKGLAHNVEDELEATYVIDQVVSLGSTDVQEVVSKTVVLHQRVQGLTPLGTTGSVEVTVDADGDVTGLTSTLLAFEKPRIPEWIETARVDTESHVRTAVSRIQRRVPGARLKVVEARVGYDGERARERGRTEAVVEVVVEAEASGFARRYAERVAL